MDYPLTQLRSTEVSLLLPEIPDAPSHIYVRGNLPPPDSKMLAVVGSRNYTNYGKQVVDHLISGLRDTPLSIISGLALGIDTLAHEAALHAGLHTIAVPGSGINDDVLYPHRNRSLARRILGAGGALVSEFEPDFKATPWSFPQRNRIMAGMSHAVLLIEAGEKSGTLITARLTSEYNRELLVVPGNIFSENSKGVHQFLKLGATPVTSSQDILEILNVKKERGAVTTSYSEEEQAVLGILTEPLDQDTIIRSLTFPREATLILLMQMELRGVIHESNGTFYKT